ncbi:MAG: high mobility group box domain-containing protein, partial [Benniella sp.]
KIKRPSNCFIKYRTQVLPEIVARFGNQNNKEISKLAAQCWKEEPEWVKSHFRQQALEEQRMLKALYPSYKYNPSR